MPDSSGTYAITVPCATEPITMAALQEFSNDQEAALAIVDTYATKAQRRPAVALSGAATAYTAGVAVLQNFSAVGYDNDNMFSLATPTIFTIRTAGSWLITASPRANMAGTNTSFRGEILINGVLATQGKDASGIAGVQPPNGGTVVAFAPDMLVGDTVSLRLTVTGVGNDFAFSQIFACLISYGT